MSALAFTRENSKMWPLPMSENKQDFNRRDFISSAGGSLAAMAAMMQALETRAQESEGKDASDVWKTQEP